MAGPRLSCPLLYFCRCKSKDKLVFPVFPPSQVLDLSEVPSRHEKPAIPLVSSQVVAGVVRDRFRPSIPEDPLFHLASTYRALTTSYTAFIQSLE